MVIIITQETQNFILWDNQNKKKIEVEAKKLGKEWRAFCPFHSDKKTPNLNIDPDKNGGVYYCFACGAKGQLFNPQFTDKKKTIEEIYSYKNEEDKIIFQVVKYDSKDFRQRRPDGQGGYIWNLSGVKRVIYNLPEILKKSVKPVFIVEGEKDCNNLEHIGILATTNSGGAGKWKAEYNQYFKDREVILIPDNDEVGINHAQEIGKSLKEIAKSIKYLTLPGLENGEDVSDWLERGGNLEKLFTLVKTANNTLEIPIEERNLITIRELMESNIKPVKMLVSGGLIPEISGFGLLGGLTKEGKTLLSLQLCLNLVSGTNFLEDFKVNRKCKVLYIYRENTKSGLNEIIKKQVSGFKKMGIDISLNDLDNFYTYYGKDIVLDLKYPRLGDLEKAIKNIKPDIIFLDPIGQFIGFDINKAENIKRFNDLLQKICSCFWILIHHYTKPRFLAKGDNDIPPIYKLLGSSYLANSCETFLGLESEGEKYSKDYKKIYFVVRSEREPIPMHLKRDPISLLYEVVDSISLISGKITKEDIIRVLKNSFNSRASYKDLAGLCSDQFGVVEGRIANLMKELKESGIIAKEPGKRGYWYIKGFFS